MNMNYRNNNNNNIVNNRYIVVVLLLLLLLTLNNDWSLSSTTSTTSVLLFVSAAESNSDNIIRSGKRIGSESNTNKISKEENSNHKTCTTTTTTPATVANDNDNDNSNGGECETSTTSTSTSTSTMNLHSTTTTTNSKSDSKSDNNKQPQHQNHQTQTEGKLSFTIDDILQLKPSDLPLPHLFTDFGSPTNTTVTIPLPLPLPTMIEKYKKKNKDDVSKCQEKDPNNCKKVWVGWDAYECERNTGVMHTHCARSCKPCTSQIAASSSYVANDDDDDDDETATAMGPTTKVIKILPGSIMQQSITSNHHKNNNDNDNAIVDNYTTASQSQSTSTTSSFESKLYVLPQFVPRKVVAQILTLLRGHENMIVANGQQVIALNEDPDPVDAMTSQRIFLEEEEIERTGGRSPSQSTPPQRELRRQLKLLMDPYKELMTSFLRTWYSDKCGGGDNDNTNDNDHTCTPCSTFLRRYRGGERRGNVPHHDSLSFISVVISLSDYDTEYQGGLYVSSKGSERHYIKLNRGDAVVHQWDLHHGVHVLDTTADNVTTSERWSWIFWMRDSSTCDDHSKHWYTDCSNAGNPACMYLRATLEDNQERIKWNEKASEAGYALASVKLGYAYLKKLPSTLDFDMEKAQALFTKAIQTMNEPDGHYALASVYLAQAKQRIQTTLTNIQQQYKSINKDDRHHNNNALQIQRMNQQFRKVVQDGMMAPEVIHAIGHLEEAARGGHPFAMFNLGLVHLYGYGYGVRSDNDSIDTNSDTTTNTNPTVAGMWFEASGLPEGFMVKTMQLTSLGLQQEANSFQQKAIALGYGSFWRQQARERAGSGGSSAVKLNLPWPPTFPSGQIPQEF